MGQRGNVGELVASLRRGRFGLPGRTRAGRDGDGTDRALSRLAAGGERPSLARLLDDPATRPTLSLSLETESGILWMSLRHDAPPSLTPGVMADIRRAQRAVAAAGRAGLVRTLVIASDIPGTFGLGGDLGLMAGCVRARDADALRRYGREAVEIVLGFDGLADWGVTSIALVAGEALGGSLEGAASCHVVVAERQARFRFPEGVFGLFPGHGALQYVGRRAGRAAAEEMILTGRAVAAEEAARLGLVDVLAEEGAGEEAVRDLVARQDRRPGTYRSVYRARRIVNPVTRAELLAVVELWVEAAVALDEAKLARMERIAAAQARTRGPSPMALSAPA